MRAITLIDDERKRQVYSEDWSAEHDDTHDSDELAFAAVAYALPNRKRKILSGTPQYWPWSFEWWKPTPEDRIKELIKAGALIVAEIERLQRKAGEL